MRRHPTIRQIITLAILIVSFQQLPASAEKATFKQQILPMDCVFQVIDVGLGTIKYITPEACGQIITPVPPSKPDGHKPTTPSEPSPSSIIPGYSGYGSGDRNGSGGTSAGNHMDFLLNAIAQARTNLGYSVTIRVGDQFRYTPLFGPDTAIERTVTVTGINNVGITMVTSPSNQIISLRLQQRQLLDFDPRHKPRLSAEYTGMQTSDSATLRLRLLNEELVATKQHAPSRLFYVLIAVLFVAILGMNRLVRSRSRSYQIRKR